MGCNLRPDNQSERWDSYKGWLWWLWNSEGMMYHEMLLFYIYWGYIDQSEACRDIKVIVQVALSLGTSLTMESPIHPQFKCSMESEHKLGIVQWKWVTVHKICRIYSDAMRSMNNSEVVGKVNPKLWGRWANSCEEWFRWEHQFGPLSLTLCTVFILTFDFAQWS
jgi:hypothetical protein